MSLHQRDDLCNWVYRTLPIELDQYLTGKNPMNLAEAIQKIQSIGLLVEFGESQSNNWIMGGLEIISPTDHEFNVYSHAFSVWYSDNRWLCLLSGGFLFRH